MGTTINGVYRGGKTARRERALLRLKQQLSILQERKKNIKVLKPKDAPEPVIGDLLEGTLIKIGQVEKEIQNLEDIVSGKKKEVKDEKGAVVVAIPKERWFIDIHQIHMSYVKNSDRRKNKGKSRKKMRKMRAKSFVKSVVLQPGMLEQYRSGKMGISPKTHSFSARKEDIAFFN